MLKKFALLDLNNERIVDIIQLLGRCLDRPPTGSHFC